MSLEFASSRRAVLAALAELLPSAAPADAARVCAARAKFKRHICVLRACVDVLCAMPAWDDDGVVAVALLLEQTVAHHGAVGKPIDALRARLAEAAPPFVRMVEALGVPVVTADLAGVPLLQPGARGAHLLWPHTDPYKLYPSSSSWGVRPCATASW